MVPSTYYLKTIIGLKPLGIDRLQHKSRKCSAQTAQDTIKQFLHHSQKIINNRDQRRNQSAERADERAKEG